jgi:hypothetical protein
MKVVRIVIVLVIVAVFPMPLMAQESNVSTFEHLKDPKISTQKNQKMLVVEAKGDPNVVGGEAFGLLFRLYYSIPETPKGPMQPAPRARWPIPVNAPKSTWIGAYALPVPETITELPPHEVQEGLKASLITWEYGKVAEILYIGPYDREEPTIRRLIDFIKEQGYVILGDHEEEYIKGPSMYGKDDPENYVTIIRYRVKKENEP